MASCINKVFVIVLFRVSHCVGDVMCVLVYNSFSDSSISLCNVYIHSCMTQKILKSNAIPVIIELCYGVDHIPLNHIPKHECLVSINTNIKFR